jgi:Na+/H+ antiporter NhaD/arsenite permease-like protein
VGLGLAWLVTAWVYRGLMQTLPADPVPEAPEEGRLPSGQSRLLIKSLAVTLGTVVLFFAGAPMAVVALLAGALLLLDRKNPSKTYREIDWPLLVMFAGLFVVVRAFEVHVIRPWGLEENALLRRDPIGALSLASAGLSNLVSNVPAVLLFVPAVRSMPEAAREAAWLALALSSTLAGNLTILGSVANLIVVEGARREGVRIGFWEYARAGVPVTLLTLALGVAWLWAARY